MDYSLPIFELLSVLSIAPENKSVGKIVIKDLTVDSREVKPGSLFFAYPGELSDGRDYIAKAVQAGAAAILFEQNLKAGEDFELLGEFDIPVIAVSELRNKIGLVAHEFF